MRNRVIDHDLELKALEAQYRNGFVSEAQYLEQKYVLGRDRNVAIFQKQQAVIDACYQSVVVKPSVLGFAENSAASG